MSKNNIFKVEKLNRNALQYGPTIILPILDEKCLSFFFSEDDELLKGKKIDSITGLLFNYIEVGAKECRTLTPMIRCKIDNDSSLFYFDNDCIIYKELICLDDSNLYLERLKNYCEYISGWLEHESKKRDGNLKLKDIFWFLKKIKSLQKYLIPEEDIIDYLSERYTLVLEKDTSDKTRK